MFVKSLKVMVGLAMLATAYPAVAQNAPAPRRYVRAPIEIHPGRPLYRRCAGWYELQYRPSGTVLYPARHCWWVRG